MVTLTNTTLDLRILELRLLLRLISLILTTRFPVRDGAEDDILSHRHGICLWARSLALFLPEFVPCFALGDARVHGCLDDGLLDAPGGLVFAAVFADSVADDCFGAVFVLGDGLLREGDVEVVVFFGPVGAAFPKC